jgi:uncharacterized delta-60 repeat protein
MNRHRRQVVVWLGMALALPASPASALPGERDPSFGSNGVVLTSVTQEDWAEDVIVQPDGKIVVAGATAAAEGSSEPGGYALLRYDPDGSLDTSFAGDGTQITPPPADHSGAFLAVARQPDGKLVAAGYASAANGIELPNHFADVLARYLPDGSLDPDFARGGFVKTTPDSPGFGGGSAIALQPDGKILVTSPVGEAGARLAAKRYTARGEPDTSFSGDGVATAELPPGVVAHAYGIALQEDGKVVVAGDSLESGRGTLLGVSVARYLADGAPDRSFGEAGVITGIPAGAQQAWFSDVALQPDGKVVAAGQYTPADGSPPDFALARYEPDGHPDPNFGTAGLTVSQMQPGFYTDDAASVVVQPDGRIVVAGRSNHGDYYQAGGRFAIARYLPNGAFDPTFGAGGRQVDDGLLGWSYARDVALQPDGALVVAGTASGWGRGDEIAVVRYQGDGAEPPALPLPVPASTPRDGVPKEAAARGPAARCHGLRATIMGGPKADVLRGTRRRDVIVGGGGADRISGLGGNDVVCGGSGRDRISGGRGNDRLEGGAGRDRLDGGAGRDRLDGGAARDRLRGGPGRDRLIR